MIYEMKLNNDPYNKIKKGSNTIELRLNDEKRKLLKVGDIIRFTNRTTNEKLDTEVISLYLYDSFKELYKHFDKKSLGYEEDEIVDYKDMELYYSREDIDKYGVLGIEVSLLDDKSIVYNDDKLKIEEVNRVVKRAKIVIENSNGEILLCFSNGHYFLLGGHKDSNETDVECLKREILEETGTSMELNNLKLLMRIKYFNRDYPDKGVNTYSIATYYYIKYDLEINKEQQNLTKEEIDGGFELRYIDKFKVIEELNNSLTSATRKRVVMDTIKVIEEYLKN